MERMPVANWLLIVGTCIVSVALWLAESKYDRSLSHLQSEVLQRKVAADKQLQGKRLTPKQREAMEQKNQDELEQFAIDRAQQLGDSPIAKAAIHADWDDFHFYELITYQFAHGDILHLVGNMIFLFCFGNAVCAKVGNVLFVPLYLLLGAIAGGLWALVSQSLMIGASGAIMGITGVFLVLYPLNEIATWTFRSMIWTGDAWRFPSWVVILFYMTLDLIGLMTDGESGGGVAYVAHLAGMACGFGVGLVLTMTRFVESHRGEQFLPEIWGWLGEKPVKRRKRKRRPDAPTSERMPDL
ncbi:MAG: rhomboid family intramembrane serine protease [Gemmataceae bacterium]